MKTKNKNILENDTGSRLIYDPLLTQSARAAPDCNQIIESFIDSKLSILELKTKQTRLRDSVSDTSLAKAMLLFEFLLAEGLTKRQKSELTLTRSNKIPGLQR